MKKNRSAKKSIEFIITILEKSTSYTGVLVGISLLLMGLVVCYGVFTRYVLNSPSIWTDQVSIYLLWGATFFGAAYAMRKNEHITVDILTTRLSSRMQNILQCIVLTGALVFVGVLFYSGLLLVEKSFLLDQRDNTLLRMKLFIPQSLIPLGSVLLIISILEKLLKNLLKLFWDEAREGVKINT